MRTCRTRGTYHRNSPRGQIWPGTRRTHRMAINFQPWKNAAQLKKLEKVRGCVYFCGRVRKYNRGPIPFTRIMRTSAIYDKNTFVAIHVFPPLPPHTFAPGILSLRSQPDQISGQTISSFPRRFFNREKPPSLQFFSDSSPPSSQRAKREKNFGETVRELEGSVEICLCRISGVTWPGAQSNDDSERRRFEQLPGSRKKGYDR